MQQSKEDKIFQLYLYLLGAKPNWAAAHAASEAVELYECLERTIADRQKFEEVQKMIAEKRAVWDILDLSVRPGNCLRAEGIYTLDDLCRMSERQVWSIPNMGRQSLNEIKEALAKIGRTLGEKV
jgi:DNA-directed RNA polymerase alpha subunit